MGSDGAPRGGGAAAAARRRQSAAAHHSGGGRGGRGSGGGASSSAAGCDAYASAASAGSAGAAAGPAGGGLCEVRQEAGLAGAYLGAIVLTPRPRLDGLLQVQYDHLHEGLHKESPPLTEWVRPRDSDEVRPRPPPPPDGFHTRLRAGDAVDVWHEAAWWPAQVKQPPVGGGALGLSVEVASPRYASAAPSRQASGRGGRTRGRGAQHGTAEAAAAAAATATTATGGGRRRTSAAARPL